jgi:hypothetical protein
MLPKKTILISAALTAFMLVILTGVGMAVRQPVQPVSVSAASLPTATEPVAVAALTPQEAASAAALFLNRQDLYSVESASFNGTESYKVTFSAGQIAYVGLDGQILSVTKIKPKVVVVQAKSNPAPARSSAPVAPSGGEHEDGGEHDD